MIGTDKILSLIDNILEDRKDLIQERTISSGLDDSLIDLGLVDFTDDSLERLAFSIDNKELPMEDESIIPHIIDDISDSNIQLHGDHQMFTPLDTIPLDGDNPELSIPLENETPEVSIPMDNDSPEISNDRAESGENFIHETPENHVFSKATEESSTESAFLNSNVLATPRPGLIDPFTNVEDTVKPNKQKFVIKSPFKAPFQSFLDVSGENYPVDFLETCSKIEPHTDTFGSEVLSLEKTELAYEKGRVEDDSLPVNSYEDISPYNLFTGHDFNDNGGSIITEELQKELQDVSKLNIQILEENFEPLEDLSILNDSNSSGESLHIPIEEREGHASVTAAEKELFTPNNQRSLPSVIDEMTPGAFFAERSGNLGQLGASPVWFTPKHDENGNPIDLIGEDSPVNRVEKSYVQFHIMKGVTPAGKRRVRPPLFSGDFTAPLMEAELTESTSKIAIDACTSPIKCPEEINEEGMNVAATPITSLKEVSKLSVVDSNFQLTAQKGPKSSNLKADYVISLPPDLPSKALMKLNSITVNIDFNSAKNRRGSKSYVEIFNISKKAAPFKIVPLGSVYQCKIDGTNKHQVLDQIFRISLMTGVINCYDSLTISISFMPFIQGVYTQAFQLRANGHVIALNMIGQYNPSIGCSPIKSSLATSILSPILQETAADQYDHVSTLSEKQTSNIIESYAPDHEKVLAASGNDFDGKTLIQRIVEKTQELKRSTGCRERYLSAENQIDHNEQTAPKNDIYETLTGPEPHKLSSLSLPEAGTRLHSIKKYKALTFGQTKLGTCKSIEIRLGNPALKPLNVKLSTTGPFSLPAKTLEIAPRSYIHIPISFHPDSRAIYNCILFVHNEKTLKHFELLGECI